MQEVLLRIKNLKKDYVSGKKIKRALKGVSLDIFKGEILAFLGINGAGKTTLSSIIATLHPPTAGEILFNNESIYKNIVNYRSSLGYCPQKPNLNPLLSLEDNLLFAGRYYSMPEPLIKKRIKELMIRFQLTDYAQAQAQVLSGGYKQRFLIARALINNPQLVIFDEPTVALDPHIRHELWQVIKELKKAGITVLITTHYLDEAEELADRVCILDQGRIMLIDKPENLKLNFKKGRLEDVFLQLLKDSKNLGSDSLSIKEVNDRKS